MTADEEVEALSRQIRDHLDATRVEFIRLETEPNAGERGRILDAWRAGNQRLQEMVRRRDELKFGRAK
jgi:hypothetical protein